MQDSGVEPEAIYRALADLSNSRPNLAELTLDQRIPDETQRWLARLHAVVEEFGSVQESLALRLATGTLSRTRGTAGVDEIMGVLYRTLYAVELQLPVSAQGSFIPAGNEFAAFAHLAKVLSAAQSQVMFVDPYADETLLTDFAQLANEGVQIRVLAAEGRAKSSLLPAAERWLSQFGATRPIEVRMAPAASMHDRAILIDKQHAWIVTQSFKDFAKKSHGSIAQADADSANLKVDAYEDIWSSSTRVV